MKQDQKELPKAYEPTQHEEAIYQRWERSGYFNPDNLPALENGEEREPYSILMPPPNVTGVLHLGHALENTLMDINIRYQRMQGKKALLLPGTDHAAVATQAKVEDVLKKEGIEHPREEFGREGLLEKIREFANESQSTIINQMKHMGTSADWSRLAYTFDEQRSKAVNEVFMQMYEDGLIYRGYRVVNWSVEGQSTASDDEVEHKERTTTLYTFRYGKATNGEEVPIPIATVLPETKLGDVAIAVHPAGMWKDYIGKEYTVENFGSLEAGQGTTITLQVIADEEVDEAFGTGALGVTPAHSQVDFEMAQRHNLLTEGEMIQVVGQDGNITDMVGSAYAGLPVKEARKKFVEYLREAGLLENEEEVTHNAAMSDRFKDEIWPMPMEQWFVSVSKEIPRLGKSLKQLMLEAVTTGHGGDESQKVNIQPDGFRSTYMHWVENLRDWNISRQIWWGHRIPIWYKGKDIVASIESPGDGWEQDPDTLDTWFSSGMWPFSTLGYPEQTEDLKNFFPTAWMQMGYEIIQLWMARMILFSTYVQDNIPFKEMYVHGILRDKDGKKFSKSAGNGIDPLEVGAEYGTDALRLSLIKGITPGNDARFYEDKVVDARNFVNKLWNITRFVLSQNDESQQEVEVQELSQADRWIESRLHSVIQQTTQLLEDQQFSQASELLYNFVWNEFADWYVELSKLQPNPAHARKVLASVLQLLHPFIPFVTEVLWNELHKGSNAEIDTSEMLIVTPWPKAQMDLVNTDLEQQFSQVQDLVIAVRNIRGQYTIPYSNVFAVYSQTEISTEVQQIVEAMGKVELHVGEAESPATQLLAGEYQLSVSLTGIIDMDAERARLEKEIALLEKQIAGFTGKLNNEGYVSNAPEQVVQETRDKLAEAETELAALQKTLSELS